MCGVKLLQGIDNDFSVMLLVKQWALSYGISFKLCTFFSVIS